MITSSIPIPQAINLVGLKSIMIKSICVYLITSQIVLGAASNVKCVNHGDPYLGAPEEYRDSGDPVKDYKSGWYDSNTRGACTREQTEWRREYNLVQPQILYMTKWQDRKPENTNVCPTNCPRVNLGMVETPATKNQILLEFELERDCRAIIYEA